MRPLQGDKPLHYNPGMILEPATYNAPMLRSKDYTDWPLEAPRCQRSYGLGYDAKAPTVPSDVDRHSFLLGYLRSHNSTAL